MDIIEIEKLMSNVKRNNMDGYYVENQQELVELIRQLVPYGSVVGSGDSVTLEQLKVFAYFRDNDYQFLDKHKDNLSSSEKHEIYLDNFRADTFITGSNAITMDGYIFNIDGNGSRVAPLLYGPNQVLIVVGVNKIVADTDAAIKRGRQIAAPLDAVRLGKDTPCVALAKCIDCHHKQRICNDFVLITSQFKSNRIKVIVINEEIGY